MDVAGSSPTLVPTATASSEFVLVDLDMERLRSGDLVYVYAKGSPKVLRTGAGGVVLGAHRRYLTVDAPAPSAPTIYGDAKPVATEIVTDCRGLFEIELVSGGIEVATGASIRLHAHPELCWGDYRPRKAQYKPASILGLAKAGGLLFSDDPAKLAEDVFVVKETSRTVPDVKSTLSAPFVIHHFEPGSYFDADLWKCEGEFPDGGAPTGQCYEQEDYRGGGRTYETHDGTDLTVVAPLFRMMEFGSATIVAARSGRVIYSSDGMPDTIPGLIPSGPVAGGNEVDVLHDDGTIAQYPHLMNGSVAVRVGDNVQCGQEIGRMGSSGNSDGPHIHFQMRRFHDPSFLGYPENQGIIDHLLMLAVTSSYEPFQERAWIELTDWTAAPGYQIPVLACFYPSPEDPAFLRMVSGDQTAFVNAWRKEGTAGDPCTKHGDCGVDYWCKELKQPAGSSACYPKADPGEACSGSVECKDFLGAQCVSGKCKAGPDCTMRCPSYKGCFYDGASSACVELNVSQRAKWGSCPHSMPACRPQSGCFADPVDNRCEGYVFVEEQSRSLCALECLP